MCASWKTRSPASPTLVMRDGKPDRELIVTLQSFDRLKQEFEALSGALARYAQSTDALPLAGDEPRAPFGRDVIHDITLSDLKERFLDRLENGLGTVFQPSARAVGRRAGSRRGVLRRSRCRVPLIP